MKKIVSLLIFAASCLVLPAKPLELSSPDGKTILTVNTDGSVKYSVSVDGQQVLAPSEISMTLADGTVYGGAAKMKKAVRTSVNSTVRSDFYRKSEVKDNYNQLELQYKAFKLQFRAYDDGVAYRFVSLSKVPFKVSAEQADFAFPEDWNAFIPYVSQNTKTLEAQLHNSFESTYDHHNISAWNRERLAFLPIMIEAGNGVKLNISESDLLDYPGMYLYNGDGDNTLSGYYARRPIERTVPKGTDGRSLWTQSRADYIAECDGARTFPWRLIGISRKDVEMTDNDMVFRLATPADPSADFSWVRPGKVAWDWWNAWNLYDVDFETGVNTRTYKYYIDFASRFGIEYVILDEGWSIGFEDLFHIVPEIDLQGLIDYGKEKNVGIILWAGYGPFQKDIEKACKVYSEMGVKGFKVDFMDSDDQIVVGFHQKAAETAAKYHLMLDFHGTYKPTGLSRTYPNVLNYEGVFGLEQMKWRRSDTDHVTYDVTIPYIRFFAGSADYTQGAMRNATRKNFHPAYTEPMSQGTRCHQLAEYVIFSSPLNMLCDSPSNYIRESECTEFIAGIPVVWDETVTIDGKVGEYVVLARRKGSTWYLGALGNWDERDLSVSLDFLGEGPREMTVFKDGINADKAARDYRKVVTTIPSSERRCNIHLAPGGGFVAIFK